MNNEYFSTKSIKHALVTTKAVGRKAFRFAAAMVWNSYSTKH